MDYQTRVRIADNIESEVNEMLDRYYELITMENAYFSVYPLMHLEEYFASQKSEQIIGMVEIKLASWILGEMIRRGASFNYKFKFSQESFTEYKEKILPIFRVLYIKIDLLDEIKDTFGITSAKITKCNNKYLISKVIPIDKYNKEEIYYSQVFDKEKFNEDRKIIKKSTDIILKKFISSKIHPTVTFFEHVKKLDQKCYEACKDRVAVDLNEWLGKNIKSEIVGSRKELIEILGYLYYVAIGYHTRSQLANDNNYIFAIKRTDLISKIRKASGMSSEKIEKYLDYFTFIGNGTLNNFPLIEVDGMYSFIPSSIILNDWQFSITQGHYIKNIEFKERDKSISRNVIELIKNAIKGVDNIQECYEHYYDLTSEKGNSDIDIAIFCAEQKSLLIIEAKWINNHYKNYDDEKFSNIYSTVNKIYEKQLSKHKVYLSDREKGLSKLFACPIDVNRIEYIAVDKRSQLHTEERHLLSVYVLIFLIKKHIYDGKLDLNKMLDEISDLRTTAEYHDLFSVEFETD